MHRPIQPGRPFYRSCPVVLCTICIFSIQKGEKREMKGKFTVSAVVLSALSVAGGYGAAGASERQDSGMEFERKVVVEEATGTWCGNCPRGIVGMAEMKERYPDTFIGIAIHGNDVMAIDGYASFVGAYLNGYPSCIANRRRDLFGDPDAQYLELLYNAARFEPAAAGIEVDAMFTEAGDGITVTTSTTFGFTGEANYNICLVLLENDVTGEGTDDPDYRQTNYYADGAMGAMGGWENMGETVQWSYDDVARGVYTTWRGAFRSVPAEVEAGMTYQYTYDMTPEKLAEAAVEDMDQLEVAALLIDNTTGEIENADKVAVRAYEQSTVAPDVADDVTVFAEAGRIIVRGAYTGLRVFDLSGKQVDSDQLASGVYIVEVTTDGGRVVRKLAL